MSNATQSLRAKNCNEVDNSAQAFCSPCDFRHFMQKHAQDKNCNKTMKRTRTCCLQMILAGRVVAARSRVDLITDQFTEGLSGLWSGADGSRRVIASVAWLRAQRGWRQSRRPACRRRCPPEVGRVVRCIDKFQSPWNFSRSLAAVEANFNDGDIWRYQETGLRHASSRMSGFSSAALGGLYLFDLRALR